MKFQLLAALLVVSAWTSVSTAQSQIYTMELRCDGTSAAQCEDGIRMTLTRLNCLPLGSDCRPGGDAFYCQASSLHCTQAEVSQRGDAVCPAEMNFKADLSDYAHRITLPYLVGGVFKKWATTVCTRF